ncbi:MAG: 2-dehydropantoate 2-reductase [Pseudomonadota bacterium]|nr:2-dehydropantoate 2-reductase [Pseudomonadota bacterium]
MPQTESPTRAGKIAVLGSGTIGTYLGGALLAAGADVILIGRPAMRARIAKFGLVLTDLKQRRVQRSAEQVPYREDAQALSEAKLILVTVKSSASAAAAVDIARHAAPGALVVSLQNGIGNAAVLRQGAPQAQVIGGMVPFNVVQCPDGRLHRGTEGELMVERCAALQPWLPVFARAHIPLIERDDFVAVQWGKLLLNLNNPVNALSGLPLRQQLSQRLYRRVLAALIDEALGVLHQAKIVPAKVGKIAPRWLPTLLQLPDWLFRRVAAQMLKIDPEARSSMWEDLQAGRATEIDYLNGAVVALAATCGLDAPCNRRMVTLVIQATNGTNRQVDGATMLRALSQFETR